MDKENSQLLKYTRVNTYLMSALLALLCLALLLVVPRITRAADRLTHTLGQLDTVLVEIDTLSAKADEALVTANKALASATTAADNANRLVVDNSDAVGEAMEKINSVDFEALNRAINDLADIVEPLARVSNFFSGQ